MNFPLEAQRNLACLHFLQGQFDDALTVMYKVHEVERRGGAGHHPDPAFRPLSLTAFYGPDVLPLELAARVLHEAAEAMYRRDVLRAEGLLNALAAPYEKSTLTTPTLISQLRLNILLARLTWAGDAARPPERQAQLLADAERLVIELRAKELKGNQMFKTHPGWLVVHANIEELMAQGLPVGDPARARREKSARDKRLSALELLSQGLTLIKQQATGKTPPTGPVPEWAVVYLEEAPRLLASQVELATQVGPDGPKVPDVGTPYADLIRQAVSMTLPDFLATAILRPLAREASTATEHVLLPALTAESLAAAGAVDRFGLSRLDWLLAAAVRAGHANPRAEVRDLLIKQCEQVPLLSAVGVQTFDALYALDPARAARITLARLSLTPPADAERLLGWVSVNPSRRSGVFARPRVSDAAGGSWYADEQAFWFYPTAEAEVTYGERVAVMLEQLAGSPQQFALIVPELEALTRRERLTATEKFAAEQKSAFPATGRLHARVAALLADARSPAALALLLRYSDGDAAGPLAIARATADKTDYAPLAAALWLADEPAKGYWNGQLGSLAWERLRGVLPPKTYVGAPMPDSAFLQAVGAAIDTDVRQSRKGPVLHTSNESAVAGRLYNDLLDAVLKGNNLTRPANLPAPNFDSFKAALDHARKVVGEAIKASPDAPKGDAAVQAKAGLMVDHAAEAFTFRVWYVAARRAADGRSLGELSLPNVTAEYEMLIRQKLAVGAAVEALRPLIEHVGGPVAVVTLRLASGGAVATVLVDDPLAGEPNELLYRDGLTLVARRVYLPESAENPRYEETFQTPDGDIVVLRGGIPKHYFAPLRDQPQLLDVLDLSLAKRAALLAHPLGPIRLSLDMSLRAPHIAWPVLIQRVGAADLNTYLAMCTRDMFPDTTYEFVAQVAPQTLATVDVAGRMKAQEAAYQRLAQAYFDQSYSGRALELAKGINDTIRRKLFGLGFLTLSEDPNLNKRKFTGDAQQRAAQAEVIKGKDAAVDLISLCDPGDPARFVLVTETGFTPDRKKWICRYRIGTVLGRSVFYEHSGDVDKLPDALRYLIAVNPGLVRQMSLDLGGLTADPMVQVGVALYANSQITGGPGSVLAEMNRDGLTPQGMKAAMELDLAMSAGKNRLDPNNEPARFDGPEGKALKAKYERYKELYAKAFPESKAQPSLGGELPPALKELLTDVQKWKEKLDVDGKNRAGEVSREVIANSHDINVWGIPNVLGFSTQNGKIIEGYIVFGGSLSPPPSYTPNPGTAPGGRPSHTPTYPAETPRWRNIDPRSGHEMPQPKPTPPQPPNK